MKPYLLIASVVLSAAAQLKSADLVDSFVSTQPLRQGNQMIERMFGLSGGFLNDASTTSTMETVGEYRYPPITFSKRIHYHKSTPCAFDYYAELDDQIEAEKIWNRIVTEFSERYGEAPLVEVPEKYMGDLSPYGSNSIRFRIWANNSFAVLVRLWMYGTEAYLEVSQNDLSVGPVIGLSEPEYSGIVLSRHAGKLPEDWAASEERNDRQGAAGKAADTNIVRANDMAPNEQPTIPNASRADEHTADRWSHRLWISLCVLTVLCAAGMMRYLIRRRRSAGDGDSECATTIDPSGNRPVGRIGEFYMRSTPALLWAVVIVAIMIGGVGLLKWSSTSPRGDGDARAGVDFPLHRSGSEGHGGGGGDAGQKECGKKSDCILEIAGKPAVVGMRSVEESNMDGFSCVGGSVVNKEGKVIIARAGELQDVQVSPNGKAILLYVVGTGSEMYGVSDGVAERSDWHPPDDLGVGRWLWLGNDRMIGQTSVYLEPVPEGYREEGWVIGVKLYVCDMATRECKEVQMPAVPLRANAYLCLDGISNEGLVKLKSLIAWGPEGKDPLDAGWFRLSNK